MAGVIKAGSQQANQQTQSSKPYFHLEDLEQRGNQYLDDIRKQADQILKDAEREAQKLRIRTIADAKKEALENARNLMNDELQRKLSEVEPMVKATLLQVGQQLQAWQQEWENRTVSLAVGIAEKVVGQQLTHAPEIVLNQIQQALRLAGTQDRMELRVHPQDIEAFKLTIEKMIENISDLTTTVMVPDDSIQPGGCVVRARYGSIDAQLETQIQRIGEELS